MRYVPLGDSYTIGTAVRREESWPSQLVERVAGEAAARHEPPPLELVANPAVNGFTSRDVIAVELPQLEGLRPELCSLLIGTNDVIQGVAEAEYGANVERILDGLERRVGRARIFGVTTPDYTVTPAGADYGDPTRRGAELQARNQLFTSLLASRAIPVVDIHDISLRARSDRSLVARDGLHPSARQYALWVERLVPIVRTLLCVSGSS